MKRGACRFDSCRGHLLEGLPSGAVSRLENGWASALGVRLPLLPLSFRCSRAVRRATVNREAQVRALAPELVEVTARPRGRTGYDAGLSIRKLRVRVSPGVLTERRGLWKLRHTLVTMSDTGTWTSWTSRNWLESGVVAGSVTSRRARRHGVRHRDVVRRVVTISV